MKARTLAVCIMSMAALLSSCDNFGTLFHGEKPEDTHQQPETAPASYVVVFYSNGAEGDVPEPQTIQTGHTVTMPAQGSLVYLGKKFSGWNRSAAGSGILYPAGTEMTITEMTKLYAYWVADASQNVTVTYNANGAAGEAPSEQTLSAGTTIALPGKGELTKVNSRFTGWKNNNTGDVYSEGSTYKLLTADVEWYAQWEEIDEFTVSFDANGASGDAPAPLTQAEGESIVLPDEGTLTLLNKRFTGWKLNNTGVLYTAGTVYMATDDGVFFAQWEDDAIDVQTWTVTYDKNNGTGTAPTPQTVDNGTRITVSSGSGLTRSGYTFDGWNTNASGTGTRYGAGSTITVTGNITLYAQWKVIPQYTVTYNANGATDGTAPAVQTAYSGAYVTLRANTFTWTNKTFTGWNTRADGRGVTYNPGDSLRVTSSVTLYATWQAVTYTLTYNANGASGAAPASVTVAAGGTITLSGQGSMTMSGKFLDGWNTNAEGTGTYYAAGTSYVVNGNVTLWAEWKEIPKAIAISAGDYHSLILKNDGSVWATGNGGRLGTGNTTNQTSFVQVATDAIAISAGGYHSLILKNDGSVWGTGSNGNWQLGTGDATNRTSFVQVTTGVSAISAGDHHSLVLKTNESVWATGWNPYGELGTGDRMNQTSFVQVATGATGVSAGAYHSLVLKSNGSVWASGRNDDGGLGTGDTTRRIVFVQVTTGAAAVSATYEHSLVLKTDGSVWATGWNTYGQLGTGDRRDRTSFKQVATGTTAISISASSSLILKTDGSVWATGGNTNGQLGTGDTTNREYFVQVATGATAISARGFHSLLLKSDGSVWATGNNKCGQLGTGDTTDRHEWTKVMP